MSSYPDLSAYKYRITKELARNREGGRIAYLAETIESETENNRQVVIKQFCFLQQGTTWQGFKTYEREIEILKSLNHPCIPKYLESFETSEGFCMVQEYKEAPSLAAKPHLAPETIYNIAVSILEILVYLQSFIPAIVHRDIKPENILIDDENNVYLIDFGLSKAGGSDFALSSIVAGTPGFISPEELFNRPLTEATDLYSLGATIIGLLTNTKSNEISKFIDDSYRFNFQKNLHHFNPKFVTWLTKMVEPNLKERFTDARSALIALKTIETLENNAKIQSSPKYTDRNLTKFKLGIGIIFAVSFLSSYCKTLQYNTSPITRTGYNYASEAENISPVYSELSPAEEWFESIKPNCNSLEITTAIKSYSPPNTTEGYAYAASCYALAGKIDRADEIIQELPEGSRAYAAEILFKIGHPIADAGDDKSAGAIMGLVLKYWTNNYMAMYHAGMSEYATGNLLLSKQHLENFLVTYSTEDIWRQKALRILDRIERNKTIDCEPALDPASLSRH
jgi:serine/threonine protein kinase